MKKIARRSAAAQAAVASPSAIVALSAYPLIPLAVVPYTKYSLKDEDEDESCWTLLPEDIVAEILLRLPIKPLFKFKCISKRYESIISNRRFAERYLQRVRSSSDVRSSSGIKALLLYPFSQQYPDGFSKNARYLPDSFGQDEDESISICYFSPIPSEKNEILASSNGLILSLVRSSCPYDEWTAFTLRVSNPLTKQWVPIPEPTTLTNSDELVFGIAARSHAYKIVLIRCLCRRAFRISDNIEVTMEIFCSVTGRWTAWKVSRCPKELIFEKGLAKKMFSYKGVLHWPCYSTVITYDPYDNPDQFGSIPLFKRKYTHSNYTSLIYSGDEEMLKCCEIGWPGFDRLLVWRLANDNSEWCVQGEFCFPSFDYRCTPLMVALNPCDPDVICHPYVKDCKVMVINLRTGTWKLVDVFDPSTAPSRYLNRRSYLHLPFIRVDLCPWSSPFYKLA